MRPGRQDRLEGLCDAHHAVVVRIEHAGGLRFHVGRQRPSISAAIPALLTSSVVSAASFAASAIDAGSVTSILTGTTPGSSKPLVLRMPA